MIVLVQFCIIIVRNGMFYEKHKSLYLVTTFLLSNRNCVYLLMKKTDKILTHLGDALCKKYIYFYRTRFSTWQYSEPPC